MERGVGSEERGHQEASFRRLAFDRALPARVADPEKRRRACSARRRFFTDGDSLRECVAALRLLRVLFAPRRPVAFRILSGPTCATSRAFYLRSPIFHDGLALCGPFAAGLRLFEAVVGGAAALRSGPVLPAARIFGSKAGRAPRRRQFCVRMASEKYSRLCGGIPRGSACTNWVS